MIFVFVDLSIMIVVPFSATIFFHSIYFLFFYAYNFFLYLSKQIFSLLLQGKSHYDAFQDFAIDLL